MNKRQIQKMQTREKILSVALEAFLEKGFLHTTTAEIAKQAGVAHGTLFLHFSTKDALVVEIIDRELEQVNTKMHELVHKSFDFYVLMDNYLSFIEVRESLFVILATELPFYEDSLRRKIMYRESLIRSHIAQSIHVGIHQGKYRTCDVDAIVQFLFGMIHYYLSLSSVFSDGDAGAIKAYKSTIITTIKSFLDRN